MRGRRLTCVCKRLDVVGQVNVDTLCVFHLLEDDSNEPHGHKFIPVELKHTKAPLIQPAGSSMTGKQAAG